MHLPLTASSGPVPPSDPAEDILFPVLETWVAANSGLLLLVGTIAAVLAVLLALVFSAKVRTLAWRLLRFPLWPARWVVGFIRSTSKRVSRWSVDRWRRVTTPLEYRDSIAELQSEWETERNKLTSEIKDFRALAETRRQEVAEQRDGYRKQLEKVRATQSPKGSEDKAYSGNPNAKDEVDFEILSATKIPGLSCRDWVLRNWGPGTAHNVYVAAVAKGAKVKQNSAKTLSAQEELLLFEYSAVPSQRGLFDLPQIRVSYENESGEKKIVFVPFPQNLNGL